MALEIGDNLTVMETSGKTITLGDDMGNTYSMVPEHVGLDVLDSLIEMEDMFARKMDGRIGPDDAADRWDRARDAITQARGKE